MCVCFGMVERLFCSRRLKPGKGDEGRVGGGGFRVELLHLYLALLYGNKHRGCCVVASSAGDVVGVSAFKHQRRR